MRKSKFTVSQIVAILAEGESGLAVGDVCRKHDLPPTSRTKVMEQSPLISENSGYETIQIYR